MEGYLQEAAHLLIQTNLPSSHSILPLFPPDNGLSAGHLGWQQILEKISGSHYLWKKTWTNPVEIRMILKGTQALLFCLQTAWA